MQEPVYLFYNLHVIQYTTRKQIVELYNTWLFAFLKYKAYVRLKVGEA